MAARYAVLGKEIKVPAGPGTWKVTLVVQGQAEGDVRLRTAVPLDGGRQHVLREECRSAELLDRPPDARHPERREVLWMWRGGAAGPFRARYQFYCTTGVARESLDRGLYAAPPPGQLLEGPPAAADRARIAEEARRLTDGLPPGLDQAEALFRFVDQEVANEPHFAGGPGAQAAECLDLRGGDAGGKARLLLALLRARGVPARVVTGLALARGDDQQAHRWVEAWVDGRWLPLCPYHHHFGHVPASYLVLGYGDLPVVRALRARDLQHAFLVEKVTPEEAAGGEPPSPLRRFFRSASLYRLPPPAQRRVEVLLLLPAAARIVSGFRHHIRLSS
jgi:hypothetical protein